MRARKWNIGVALVAALIAVSFAGCPQPANETVKNDAALITSITVADVSVTAADPISQDIWLEAASFFDLDPGQLGAVMVLQEDLAGAAIAVSASSGATVKYAAASSTGDLPQTFQDSSTINLTGMGYLCLQVTAEDGKAVNYYVLEITVANAVATLNGVTIAGVPVTLGTPNADPAQVTAGSVTIPQSQTPPVIVATKGHASQTVEYGVGATVPPALSLTAPGNLADGDTLWIKVTSQSGVSNYYKIAVTAISDDTTITNVQIKGATVTLGTAGTAFLDSMDPATFITTPGAPVVEHRVQSAADLQNVTLTANAPQGGSVKAIYSLDGITVTDYPGTAPSLDSGTYIGFEVSSAFGTKAYYRFRILYGSSAAKLSAISVNSLNGPNHLGQTAWETLLQEYNGAANANYDAPGAAAVEGTALIGWPAFGYGYNMETFTPVPRAPLSYIFNLTSLPAAITISGTAESNGTIRYALSANADGFDVVQGQMPTSILQPEGGQTSGSFATASSGNYIWVQVTSEDKANVMYYRFRLASGSANANITGMTVAGRTVNVSSAKATEAEAVAAPVILYFDPAVPADAALIAGAEADSTTKPSAPAAVPQDITATVSYGTYTDYGFGGSTTWQEAGYDWFAHQELVFGDWNITIYQGLADNTTIVARVTAQNGVDTKYIAVLIRTIASPTPPEPGSVEKIVAGGSSVPVYRFTPPDGGKWSDYATLTFTVMVTDQASYDETAARAHIMGNYPASSFGTTGVNSVMSNWNVARLVTISGGGTLSAILGNPGLYTWKTLSYPIAVDNSLVDNTYASATYYPAADAAGPFYFGLGLTVNPNSAADRTVTYYIKDVALVKADGTTKLPADDLGAAFGSTTVGQLKCIFSNAAGAVVNRTLETEPAAPSGE